MRLLCLSVITSLAAGCASAPAAAAPAPTVARDHAVTVDDHFANGYISAHVLAPDGVHAAWVEGRWGDSEDGRNNDIWVVGRAGTAPRRLTFEQAGDSKPRFGPDSRWVYFLSSRKWAGDDDASRQVWRVPTAGGTPNLVTRVKGGVENYALAADGASLVYTVKSERQDDDGFEALRKSHADVTYGHGVVAASQVWRLSLSDWRADKLVDEGRYVRELAVSPDGRYIAMVTDPTRALATHEGWSHVDVYDGETATVARLADALWRKEAASAYGWILDLSWAGDSRHLAFRVDYDGHPGRLLVATLGAEAPPVRLMPRLEEEHYEGVTAWRPGSRDLCYLATHRALNHVYCARGADGSAPRVERITGRDDKSARSFAWKPDGKALVALMSGSDHDLDLFDVPNRRNAQRYTRRTQVNPQMERWQLPTVRRVSWKSTDGTEVEGILELPWGYEPGEPLPTVLHLHGGPTATTWATHYFSYGGRTLFAARGWALFSPNYRGSTGYGDRFMTDLIGHKNDRDVADILSGLDHLVAEGIADPERLAVMGWSNGGYLTNCVITRTERPDRVFKAAISGAGVVDTAMQWMIEDTPGHVVNFNGGGFPWNRDMGRSSPLYAVDKVKTPTLIHVGANDERVPPEHSRGLFRALHRYLGVTAQLMVYPGEGHGLSKRAHRKAKMEWDIAWLDKWVLGKGKTPAAEPASPAPGPQ